MKLFLRKVMLMALTTIFYHVVNAQEVWPLTIKATDGTVIKVYQFQPDSFTGNTLKSISAVSVLGNGSNTPAFGTIWSTSRVETDRNTRQFSIESISISDIKIPADSNNNDLNQIKATLESKIPEAAGNLSLDETMAALDQNLDETKLSNDINTQVPQIIYASHPTVLVTIDGDPKMQENKKWGVDAVINSPFTIVKNNDGRFYLYGGEHWYSAASATGPYQFVSGKIDRKLKRIENTFAKNNTTLSTDPGENTDSIIPAVIVTTTPAEMIQSDGEPDLLPIPGTALLYVENSSDDIFLDTNSQQYYILISGRWYNSKSLTDQSAWEFVASDKLPQDFTKIPNGSPKDNVLASVAGTEAAKEAVMDAQMAQTAKVDRNSASTQVSYDGDPQFQPIAGTRLQYAVNTSSVVLLFAGSYYALDNGVWFISNNAAGPWTASIKRPGDLDLIPPSSWVYNAKFVNIYDYTPNDIYVGYTAGYLNSFIYGPTVVYGTGIYYHPWIGNHYFPRPWSWGFGVIYNPWYGWSFGSDYGFDWFNAGFGLGWGGWYGGWWGPSFYHPAYWNHEGNHYGHSFYGRNMSYHNGYIHSENNIYRDRHGIETRNGIGISGNRNLSNRTTFSNGRSGRSANNVFSDRQGNVFQRGSKGQWQMNSSVNHANNFSPETTNNLDRQQQMREAGQARVQSFQHSAGFSPGASGVFHGAASGGGGFHGGGGGSHGGGGGFHGGGGGRR
jgi:hypothetical protein